ncbi:DNA polymerase/3'-5' exonuclease PolX [candidate division KSB1 bacterium]|nr:MAG: DNA polymerase/3'-5' exonuclease PolX [candidate division KSB1 bacterium]
MKNHIIADMFEKMAAVLEFKGEMPFKVNAYRKASRVIGDLQVDIEQIWRQGRLEDIPGIGSGLAKKIDEFLRTGRMTKYEEVMADVPPGLIELLEIQNLGPKTLALAHEKLQVNNLEDLKRVLADGSLARLPGMGAKKAENIIKGIELYERAKGRISLGIAVPLVEEIITQLQERTSVKRISPAGSLRRMRETVGDIDILVETEKGAEIIAEFVHLPQVTRVLAAGDTKGSIIVEGEIQVDLRAVRPESYGSALQYFTGSKAHNIHLREIAKKRGLKISEYGIFCGKKQLGGSKEEEIYENLDLVWIPPEIREDRGEIERAAEHNLPNLVSLEDIAGDLHVHSNYSDASISIEEIARKAKELGYSYIAICDHSQSAKYARGVEVERSKHKWQEIKQLNTKISGITILSGTEVDILADGTLDYPDEILAQMDIVVAAIHSGFKQRVTERLIAAMQNPYVNIIAHPTGRLISKREGYEVDLDAVLRVAAQTGTALEINAYYDRLDLSDVNARRAADMGIKLAINTDAHLLEHFRMMRLGVGVARRAWLEPKDVLNTWPLEKIRQFCQQKWQKLK